MSRFGGKNRSSSFFNVTVVGIERSGHKPRQRKASSLLKVIYEPSVNNVQFWWKIHVFDVVTINNVNFWYIFSAKP